MTWHHSQACQGDYLGPLSPLPPSFLPLPGVAALEPRPGEDGGDSWSCPVLPLPTWCPCIPPSPQDACCPPPPVIIPSLFSMPRTPTSCKPFPLSVRLDACVHLRRTSLSPAHGHLGVATPHSPSSTPRVAGPGRRACSSILMPSNILAQSVCPRGKHLSSDSGPVAISMRRGARSGPRRPGCLPARPPAHRRRDGPGAGEVRLPRGWGCGWGRRRVPGERGGATRWPRAPAS